MTYRIVFLNICPKTRLLVKEYGPWHSNIQVVQKWLAYFNQLGHWPRMQIEKQTSTGARHYIPVPEH
jgi:hypothetical protein